TIRAGNSRSILSGRSWRAASSRPLSAAWAGATKTTNGSPARSKRRSSRDTEDPPTWARSSQRFSTGLARSHPPLGLWYSAAHTPADGESYNYGHESPPRRAGVFFALREMRAGAVVWGMGSVCRGGG